MTIEKMELTLALNDAFEGKIFRIKGFGPAILNQFERILKRNVGTKEFNLIFKGLFDHRRHSVKVSISDTEPECQLLPFVISEMFEIIEKKDVTEWDYILFKKLDTTKVDLGQPLTREMLDESIEELLSGSRMAKPGELAVQNPRMNAKIQNMWVDEIPKDLNDIKINPKNGKIIMVSTPSGKDWFRKEYEALFLDPEADPKLYVTKP